MEGIFHFNKLIQLVRQDQFQNPDFVTNWLMSRKQDLGHGHGSSQKRDGPLSPEGYAQWSLSVEESDALFDPRNRKKMDDITKRLRFGSSNNVSKGSPKKVMMNELNILKTQEVIGEPNSDGTSKKNRNLIGKGNNGSKKRNSMESSGISGSASKKKARPSRSKVAN